MAQPKVTEFKSLFRLEANKTNSGIKVDGILDDPTWQAAKKGTDFWQKVPFFAESADPKTEVMLSYDSENLYVAAKCYQDKKVLVQSLKRDVYWDNDGIAVILDPLNTRTNAFIFGVTGVGAQWDALRSPDNINSDWSNKWFSATHQGDGFWSMEMAIPLRIIRYAKDQTEWGMNFVRNHMNENEYHNWTAVPESFWPPDPAYAGALVFEDAPELQKGNYNLIPFVTANVGKTKNEDAKVDFDAGLDAKLAVSPTLNLDLTVNPDFSQIEVDELVTNLTRFNIFLPEKRTFFLENSDLFSDYGYPAVRPFFSRRIGLDRKDQAVPILYGARLTGNLTNSTRIGVMNVHSKAGNETNAQNQSAISVQKLFGRSYVKGILLNRQGYDGWNGISDDYGRNVGLESAYVSDNGQLNFWAAIHKSFKPEISEKSNFYNIGGAFNNPHWEFLLANGHVQDNYHADMGFIARIRNYDAERDTVIRAGFNETVANATYRIRPKSGPITRHVFSSFNEWYLDNDFEFNERLHQLDYRLVLRSTSEINVKASYNEVELLYPFRFVREGTPLPVGNYGFSFLNMTYKSDERKAISFELKGRIGDFYNGQLNQASANVNFRMQPWGNLSMGYQWNDLEFPQEYGSQTITALLSKLEIGFSNNLFWTTLCQYVDQSEFLGINSRLQWRFAPMSDIYLVYVDNYDVYQGIHGMRDITSNNRALILKVSYWY